MTTETRDKSAVRAGWRIDPAHSTVEFEVKNMLFRTVVGRFNDVSGQLMLDEGDLRRSSVEVEIPVATINTASAKRDKHLRTNDYFDAERVPTIRFRSSKIEDSGSGNLRVIGDLTVRDTTRSVTLEVTQGGRGRDAQGSPTASFFGSAILDRQDFGLSKGPRLMIGNRLNVKITLQAVLN